MISKYGNDGYAVYYRLNEVLGKTPNHAIPYGTPIDKEYLASETGVDVEYLDKILSTMVSIDYLDKDVWESSETIWSDEFVESISEVYDKRTTDLPTKYSFQEKNPSFRIDNPQSKVKKSKLKKRKERGSKAGSLLSLDEYQKLYPDKDIVSSYKKLLNIPNASHTMAIKWFDGEMNMKSPVFRKTPNGDNIAYCSKCGNQEFPNDYQLKLESNFMIDFDEEGYASDIYHNIDDVFTIKQEVDKFINTIQGIADRLHQ